MDTNGHYDVVRGRHSGFLGNGEVKYLTCVHCNYSVGSRQVRKGRSGRGRYNRMRALLVKHLHAQHRDELANGPLEEARLPQ